MIQLCDKTMKKMLPLLSVIVPVYNGQEYLKETINAILSSSYSNIELIIVDDGSVDQSEKIYTEIAEKDNRLRIFKKEHGGIVSARNYGIDRAKGDYVCFCDQDDIVHENMYEKIIKKMLSFDSDIGFCSTGRLIRDKLTVYEQYEEGAYLNDEIEESLLYPLLFHEFSIPIKMSKGSVYPSIWKCVFSMKFFSEYGFRFRRFVDYEDDLIMFIETLAKAKRVTVNSEIMYYWRVNLNSESHRIKYIHEIEKKQNDLKQYLCSILKKAGVSDRIIKEYSRALSCRFYVDQIVNLTSPLSNLSFKEKINYIDRNIYNTEFDDNIKIAEYANKKYIRAKIMYTIISLKKPYVTYSLIAGGNRLFNLLTKNTTLVKIERYLKRNDGD